MFGRIKQNANWNYTVASLLQILFFFGHIKHLESPLTDLVTHFLIFLRCDNRMVI